MKKIIVISAIALLCASMVFAFTKKDLAGLKGTWEGTEAVEEVVLLMLRLIL